MGIALFYAQMGGVHPAVRPMKGPALAGVMEIVEDFDRSTYRAMYTTKLGDVVYVLCAFQKKSTRGIRTPQHLVAVIVERLKQARASCGPTGGAMSRRKRTPRFEASSGNVFADLGFKHPEEELLKAQLVYQIGRLIAARQLTQGQAARLLGIPQPKASLLLRGTTAGFSTDRLIRCLNRLDQDVEIIVRQKPASRPKARVRVVRQPSPQAPSRSRQAHAVA